jgi:AcrR family transcriptional regulator
MGVQERRAREKQELRQEILSAARELFIREGFENLSMRKIAEKIEYSPTTIYLYFQDKADLLDCICEETLEKLESRLAALRTSISDPVKRLRSGLRAYIEFGLEYPNDYRVAFMMEVKQELGGPEKCPRCHEQDQKTFDHLRGNITECIGTGAFGMHDVEATSQTLWAAAHGLISLLILHPSFPWLDRPSLIDHLLDTLVNGLKCAVTEGVA